jgi:hypothetical protein
MEVVYDEGFANAIPDNPIMHRSGYTLNMPLGLQNYPGWQHDEPEAVAAIIAARKELGIVIADDLLQEPGEVEAIGSPWDVLDERPNE